MTPQQALLQTSHVIAAIQRADGGGLLFGPMGTVVACDFDDSLLAQLPDIACVINAGDEDADTNEPRRNKTQAIELLVFCKNASDPYGGVGLIELMDICDDLVQVIGVQLRDSGLQVSARRKSAVRPAIRGDKPRMYRAIRLEVRGTGANSNEDRYPAASGLSGENAGGTVTLTWTNPLAAANRYDWRGVTVLRKAGEAATSVTDESATVVTTDLDAATVDDTPGDGTWFYSVFTGYDRLAGLVGHTAGTSNYGTAVSTSVEVSS